MPSMESTTVSSPISETYADISSKGSKEKMEFKAESPLDSGIKVSPGLGSPNLRKNVGAKDGAYSSLHFVNKSASQIRKPAHRRNVPPLNWFPRKKIEPYLKRKIRLLQEVGGMKASLDETLGSSNPHYSRIAREKIAAREAARMAIHARKAAMVEASWCRILRAAGIQCKEAETQQEKAEKCAEEAFEAATAMGVMMYDRHDSARHSFEIDASSAGGGVSTHAITASFETAFEIDKEVAAAVKRAFIRLSSSHSSNKEEFRDLLHKISQNPDSIESEQVSEISLASESVSLKQPELEAGLEKEASKNRSIHLEIHQSEVTPESSSDLADMMLQRLKNLREDQLSPLAKMVATCGLNAALREADCPNTKRKEETEVPSLDKFLVKHVSRLEREVQEARNSRQKNAMLPIQRSSEADRTRVRENVTNTSVEFTSDLGSILVKHVSRLEREIKEAKALQSRSLNGDSETRHSGSGCISGRVVEHPSGSGSDKKQNEVGTLTAPSHESEELGNNIGDSDKENIGLSPTRNAMGSTIQKDVKLAELKPLSRSQRANVEVLQAFSIQDGDGTGEARDILGLDKILIKPVHRLEKEKMMHDEVNQGDDCRTRKINTKRALDTVFSDGLEKVLVKHSSRLEREKISFHESEFSKGLAHAAGVIEAPESLDKVLVKHTSRLEREKLAFKEGNLNERQKRRKQPEKVGESLDDILVKHQSKLEKAKLSATEQKLDKTTYANSRKEAREKELQETWGGLSLGNSIRPHLSRLEREKAAWRRAEEEERRRAAGWN